MKVSNLVLVVLLFFTYGFTQLAEAKTAHGKKVTVSKKLKKKEKKKKVAKVEKKKNKRDVASVKKSKSKKKNKKKKH